MRYFHHDHLGSIAAVSDEGGTVVERMAFDPWGKRRFVNGKPDTSDTIVGLNTDRGYTMHEHLDEMGVIHMNGRVYDPLVGRFMSADPFIQSPDSLQSFNRYAYVMNNPLAFTDPSGYFSLRRVFRAAVVIAVAVYAPQVLASSGFTAAAATATGFSTAVVSGAATGFLAGAVATGTLKGAVIGGITGGALGAVGDLKLGAGTPQNIAAHAMVGCASNVASGGSCQSGAMSAGLSELATPYVKLDTLAANVAARAIIGGTASVLGGGKFENGAITAAFGYLYNECAHTRRCSDWMYTGDNRRVLAVESGVVTDVGWQDSNNHGAGFGYRVKITSIDGQKTWIYAHMDPNTTLYTDLLVRGGDFIGNYAKPANGNVTGPHLHLEARDNTGHPVLNQGSVFPIPGGRKTSDINPNRTLKTNNGWQTRPHNGTDWVGGTQ